MKLNLWNSECLVSVCW